MPRKRAEPLVTLTVRMPKPLQTRLMREARKGGQSVNAYIVQTLDQAHHLEAAA